MIRALKGRNKVTVRIDDIMVDITNFGQDEDFTADCLLIMNRKKTNFVRFSSRWRHGLYPRTTRKKEKEQRIEQVWTYKFYQ